MSATDRPTIPNDACEHKQTVHEHGSHACYVLDRCRCADCSAANTRYERSRTIWLARVKPHPLVDAEPVRAHVQALVDAGMGPKQIAAVSGVSHGALWKLRYGKNGKKSRSKKVRRETAERLYAIELELADGARVPADEAWRIVNELVARGWTKAAIGRRTHGPDALSLQLGTDQVTVGHLATLRTLLDAPVPARQHPSGSWYQPKGRPARKVAFTTPGVRLPGDAALSVLMAGKLECRACRRPFAEHSLMDRCAA